MSLHTTFVQCAKIVDEKNNRLFCCLSDRDFEPNILIKGVHLTNFEEKNLFDRKMIFFEERYTYRLSKKAKTSKCHRTTMFYIHYEFI